jgi:hypothetical protein
MGKTSATGAGDLFSRPSTRHENPSTLSQCQSAPGRQRLRSPYRKPTGIMSLPPCQSARW